MAEVVVLSWVCRMDSGPVRQSWADTPMQVGLCMVLSEYTVGTTTLYSYVSYYARRLNTVKCKV